MYNFPSGRIYLASVSWSWKLQEVVFGYEATYARGKEPSFFVVAQRAFNIETSFRVIGIQIFYPWHPGFFLLRGTRRVLPAEGGSKETIEPERAKRKGRWAEQQKEGRVERDWRGVREKKAAAIKSKRESEIDREKRGGGEGIIPRLNIGKNQYYLFSSTHCRRS